MPSRQQDQILQTGSRSKARRREVDIIGAALPLFAAVLTVAAILAGFSSRTVILLCASGAVVSAAAFYLLAKTRPASPAREELPLPMQQVPHKEAETPAEVSGGQAGNLARLDYRDRRLQYEQMIEVINNLTGVITHDMDHRLEIINANIESVIDQLHEQPALKRKLKIVQATVGKASALMTKLASFASQKDWQLQHVDIREQLSSTADLIRRSLLSETTPLKMAIDEDLWLTEVDPDQLQMAIINIVLNSREAMPRGGTIRLTAKNVFLENDHLQLYGNFVGITISDTGSGIAPENIDKVFRPFFSTKELRNGIGLGLNQVKTFAMRVNGDVTIESTLDEGTSVTLYIPRATDFSDHVAVTREHSPQPRVEILIADDEKDVAAELEVMASELGHTVRTATNPVSALTTIRTDRPDLVVTDSTMPGTLDGITLGRQLRHRHPKMPIILMTDNPLIAADNSDFSVILKPVTSEKLEAVLRRHLSTQKCLRETA